MRFAWDIYVICMRCVWNVRLWYWSCPMSRNRERIISHRTNMPQGVHKYVKKTCPRWDWNPRPEDFVADALPVEPQQLMVSCSECCRFLDCVRNAVNENVALSAIAVTAQKSAGPTNHPVLMKCVLMRYVWDMNEICMRYLCDMYEMCMWYVWDLYVIFMRC